ncbi:MAG TPA: hypothetical protein DCG69_11705 [Bacteroidales bacterium]|nr:hypothetical protein [Bacteroidales bacterium]
MTSKNTILIVDDIQSNLILLNKILTDEGYHVISASNGEEAIHSTKDNNFDLILLDIMMPKKDGFMVFEELKANKKTASIPVIFITVINNDADTLKAFEMGAVDYITKPYTPTELRIRIKTQIALVNAQKANQNQADDLLDESDESHLSFLQNEIMNLKTQLKELEFAKLNEKEKDKLERINTEAIEIVEFLSQIRKTAH